MDLNFSECYKILGITEECDWATFRKNYKSLIQQHHPDRFPENTPEHVKSEEAIRNYTAAYKVIFDHYQLNQSLPNLIGDSTNTEQPVPTQRKKRPPVTQPALREKEYQKTSFIMPVITSSILTSALVITLYLINSDDESDQQIKSNPSAITTTRVNTDYQETTKAPTKQQVDTIDEFYTIGSSLGEVIILEGKPHHIINTTWYYGKSSITFTNGVVSSWSRHPDYPLKIRINPNPIYNFKKPETPEVTITKKPYWQK